MAVSVFLMVFFGSYPVSVVVASLCVSDLLLERSDENGQELLVVLILDITQLKQIL